MLSADLTLGQAFAEVAQRHAEREALVCGADRLTYGELAGRVNALAAGLCALGVGPGDRLASLLPPGWPAAACLLAASSLGGVAVPLDPKLRQRQLEMILGEVEPAVLFVAEPTDLAEPLAVVGALAKGAAPNCRLVTAGKADGFHSLEGVLQTAPALAAWPGQADDLAAILYTSGTTGRPKGVMHSHRGLISPVVASMRLRRMWLQRPTPAQLARMGGLVARYGRRLLQAAGRAQTFLTALGAHAIAGLEVLLQALLMGDRLIWLPHFHPLDMLETIERERVTVLVAAPLGLSVLLRMRDLERFDLSSLLICGTGAAPCSPELARAVQQRLGCAVHIGYGMTEAGGGIAATSIEDSPSRQAETVGRPMDGVEVRVVDEERRPLPAGHVGELAYRGPSRMLGYYRSPEMNRAAIDEDGWLYTGDMAVLDSEGYIRIVGRKKDLIIRGGQNIFPAEIERCIASLPGVAEVAVIGVADRAGDERVWAFVEAVQGADLTAQDVLRHCRQNLEAFKIPEQVRIVAELPRAGPGKVAKAELRARVLSEPNVVPKGSDRREGDGTEHTQR
ncbi:MAG: class I adenylate-forming enzyme family protein [Anaerolineae bacterium]